MLSLSWLLARESETAHRVRMVILDVSLTSAPATAAAHRGTTMFNAGSTCETSKFVARPADPRISVRYDRAHNKFDRHANYIARPDCYLPACG